MGSLLVIKDKSKKSFNNEYILGETIIEGCRTLRFKNCHFISKLLMSNCGNLWFEDCTFYEEVVAVGILDADFVHNVMVKKFSVYNSNMVDIYGNRFWDPDWVLSGLADSRIVSNFLSTEGIPPRPPTIKIMKSMKKRYRNR